MTNCLLCGSGNAITLFTSTQCVNKSCLNYDASWEAEILDTAGFNVLRHNAIDIDKGGFLYKDSGQHDPAMSFEGTTFKAHILYYARHNSYWNVPANEVFADPDNIPKPECYAADGNNGSKYGKCGACPFGKFGSASNGLSRACRQQIKLYLKIVNNKCGFTLKDPTIFWVSPINMNAFQNEFLMQELQDRGLKYTECTATITSYPNKLKTFRRVNFEFGREMSGAELKGYNEYRQNWLDKIKYVHENPKY